MKIPLSLLLAFSGGGAFWMWQQQKIKKLKYLKNLEEESIKSEIEKDNLFIINKEVDKYYQKELILEDDNGLFLFANDVIQKLVMNSQEVYNHIGKKLLEEEKARKEKLSLQEEEENKQKKN